MAVELKNKGIYSFEVYAAPILGSSFANVTVLSSMTEEIARSSGFATAEMHAQVFPFLPAEANCPDDPTAYDYVLIKTLTGQKAFLGLPWIKASSIIQVDGQTLTMSSEGLTASDVTKIRAAMAQMGYNGFTYNLR